MAKNPDSRSKPIPGQTVALDVKNGTTFSLQKDILSMNLGQPHSIKASKIINFPEKTGT